MFRDSKFDFDERIKGIFDKTGESVGLIRKLRILDQDHRDHLF